MKVGRCTKRTGPGNLRTYMITTRSVKQLKVGLLTPIFVNPREYSGQLELITDIPASNQVFLVEDIRFVAELNDDSKPLESYGFRDWQVIR